MQNFKSHSFYFIKFLAFVLLLSSSTPVSAFCGNIITSPDPDYDYPITNCTNPFNSDPAVSFTTSVNFGDFNLINNSEYSVVSATSTIAGNFSYTNPNDFGSESLTFYKKTGLDYVLVSDYIKPGDFTWQAEVGEYVAIITYEPAPILNKADTNWWQKVWYWFIPTTFAFYDDYVEVEQINFTIKQTDIVPGGASSVLFLPGIMGSHLYENSVVCDPDGLVKEQERWVSMEDCDHLRLTTNFIGQSDNDIYTKAGEVGLVDEVYTFNIYKTFLSELKTWKSVDVINNYAIVPYDWRSELNSILMSSYDEETGKVKSGGVSSVEDGYLYKTITKLATNSKTGKVTIVAHSNGGLVIKQLLVYLKNKNDPLLNKIDNLILVAVPQLGTPNSLIGILHGQEIGPAGVVMKQSVSRQLTNTMPFSHHLLPSQTYFNLVQTPVIKFEAGSSTDAWRNTFGPEISDTQSLYNFMSKDSGREKPALDDLSSPEVVDVFLLNNYAKIIDLIQSNWQSPASMKVYQVAGTGLETPSGITYFTDKECTKRSVLKAFLCSEYGPKLGYRANMVSDGDGVVVTPSAMAIDNNSNQVESWWLDLFKYSKDGFLNSNTNRQHKDIFEVPDIINLISNTIQGTNTLPYLYLSTTSPEFTDKTRLTFQLHSPLDMSLVTADGRIISSSTNTIKGSTYRRYGELQYVSVPSTETNSILHLNGLATGSFTLETEEKIGGTINNHKMYSAIPSSTSTKVIMELNNTVLANRVLQIDYEGDGRIDVVYNTEGVVAEEITYDILLKTITNLNLKPLHKQPLLITAKLAEGFYKKSLTQNKLKYLEKLNLNLLLKQISVYEKYKLISIADKQELERIINSLLNK